MMSSSIPVGVQRHETVLGGEIVSANPSHVWIEPTSRCNTRCVHCNFSQVSPGEDMPWELDRKICDSALDCATQIELVGSGEPFLASVPVRCWTSVSRAASRF